VVWDELYVTESCQALELRRLCKPPADHYHLYTTTLNQEGQDEMNISMPFEPFVGSKNFTA
jgi:hypothetical protein